jgi:threonine/homoserine/homoserine lactone efflux protein
MPSSVSLITFCTAAFLLNIAPGPDMLYVIGRSVGQGRKAGIVSALGIFVGCLVHVTAAAAGLAALLRSSPVGFSLIRYAGAAYLIYLGASILLRPPQPLDAPETSDAPMGAIFRQGVITNVLNPKVALFFLAFLPQFTDASRGPVALQVLLLGLIFDVGGTLVNLVVAFGAGHAGEALKRNRKLARLQKWITGTVFVGLGMRIGLSRS